MANLIYKSIPFQTDLNKKNLGEDTQANVFRFAGYGSTFHNIDLDGDVIEPGAFKASLQEMTPKFLLMHNMRDLPIGIFPTIQEDKKGLFLIAEMPLDDDKVRGRIVPQLKTGSINSLSIGFEIQDSEIKKIDRKRIRFIQKVKLFEVSLVTIPANPQAQITAMKAMLKQIEDKAGINKNESAKIIKKATTNWRILPKELTPRDTQWDSEAAIKRWRDAVDSTEKPNGKYKRNFLWYDATKEENFGSYKLPIGDIVEGKHMAVPRAIFAARAALVGARGGVDIPEVDRKKVEMNINKYYEVMGLEMPFKSGSKWCTDEIKQLCPSDLSYILRSEQLSRKAADYIVSVLVSEETKASQKDETGNIKKDKGTEDIKAALTAAKEGVDIIKQLRERLTGTEEK